MAGKGFLSTVHSHTNLENVHSFKWFCTQKAPEGFLPSVHSHMILKDAWRWCALSSSEGYPTHQMIFYSTLKAVADILIRVYSLHVVLKDTFLWKPCFTKWTVVWFLSSVQSNVGLKVRFLCKRFFTQWTAVGFLSSVQSNVGLKVMFLCKRFFTQWTAVRFLSSVQSHVVLKIAF